MALDFMQQVYLILTGGLPREAARQIVLSADCPAKDWGELRAAVARHLRDFPSRRPAHPVWPDARQARGLAARLEREGVGLVWREGKDYPIRLAKRLKDAPAWLWMAGDRARLDTLTCSVVGSRKTPPKFLNAATRLGQALSEAGICVVSGLAEGADTAAHIGAMLGPAGTIAFPARGILRIDLAPTRAPRSVMTAMALDWPDDPISAAKAVRRNSMIAAMGEGLVLVASTLTGGSSYAVRWALERGHPIWAFQTDGTMPAANRQLIHAGKAIALNVKDDPRAWVRQIEPALRANAARQTALPGESQLDWLRE